MTGPSHAADHATPITPTERDGLIPTHVTLRGELNELEQKNVAEADSWAFGPQRAAEWILTIDRVKVPIPK